MLKKLILNIIKALKLKMAKVLKRFLKGILVAAPIALLFIHSFVFLNFISLWFCLSCGTYCHNGIVNFVSISIAIETLKIKFSLVTRFRAALLSYFRSAVAGERGLTNKKIWWLVKGSLFLGSIMETDWLINVDRVEASEAIMSAKVISCGHFVGNYFDQFTI